MRSQLKDYSYFKTGGTCERLCLPTSIEELQDVMQELARAQMPYFLLGGGTNSLVMDEHWPGAVVAFARMQQIEVRANTVYVEAGVENSTTASRAHQAGLAGAAWMNGLPGQLGGTIRMNARCYGGEISEIATRVICVTRSGQRREYTDRRVFRGYKDTLFMANGDLVAAAELTLTPGNAEEIFAKMKFCQNDRVMKGQYLFPNCGCVFKNDYSVGVPSGMLLEEAGAKQIKFGAAEVSPYHANFVYNKGCTSREIIEVSVLMRQAVYQKFGVWLEYEMEILGKVPADLAAKMNEQRPRRAAPELDEIKERFQRKLKSEKR